MMSHSLHGQLFPFLLGAHETQQTVYRSNSFCRFLRLQSLVAECGEASKTRPWNYQNNIKTWVQLLGSYTPAKQYWYC